MGQLEASFSMLVMSLASSAAMSLGLAPHPQTGDMQKDKAMAKFNIDLLLILQEKSKNNLTPQEKQLIDSFVTDLQMKFVQMQEDKK